MAITRAQQYRQMLKDGKVAMQGGGPNYLGKQKTVSNVPIKWQSGPNKPPTELAYITEAEKKLLLKHNSKVFLVQHQLLVLNMQSNDEFYHFLEY